jgi:uncharacterized protein
MNAIADAAREFLAQKRIAVAGVSRDGALPANFIYRRLRDAGYDVYAINPRAESVEGDRCYRSLEEVPAVIDGVVIATPPGATLAVVQQCVARDVRRIWMHRSVGTGSFDAEAAHYAAAHGIAVIPDGCPMMFLEPVDGGHKCIRFINGLFHRGPNKAATAAYLDVVEEMRSSSRSSEPEVA